MQAGRYIVGTDWRSVHFRPVLDRRGAADDVGPGAAAAQFVDRPRAGVRIARVGDELAQDAAGALPAMERAIPVTAAIRRLVRFIVLLCSCSAKLRRREPKELSASCRCCDARVNTV
jgi:hypothetical protein